MKDKLTMLMILDGFGDNPNKDGNAIKLAKTPNIDRLIKKYPNTEIYTSGLHVGLPEGQMGNSEVQVDYMLDYQKDKWEIQK